MIRAKGETACIRRASKRVTRSSQVDGFKRLQGSTLYHKSKPKKPKVVFTIPIPVPPHMIASLNKYWKNLESTVNRLTLCMRYDPETKSVVLTNCPETDDPEKAKRALFFVKAFFLGFDLNDALLLVRHKKLSVETTLRTFILSDVETVRGRQRHSISRLIRNETEFSIENVTNTKIILDETKIHILGSKRNIQVAISAVYRLIRGYPPSMAYRQIRNLAMRNG